VSVGFDGKGGREGKEGREGREGKEGRERGREEGRRGWREEEWRGRTYRMTSSSMANAPICSNVAICVQTLKFK